MEKGGNGSATPLMYASSAGHTKTVQVLIKNGANVNVRDDDGDTALAYAAVRGAPIDLVKTLLSAGADVNIKNNRGQTALMLATEQRKSKIVELLTQSKK